MATDTLPRHAAGRHRRCRVRLGARKDVAPSFPEPENHYERVIKPNSVAVIVPARNEEEQVGATIQSLLNQTRPIDRILVIPNNCTDHTADIAWRYDGVEVLEIRRNPFKKAGALNSGIQYLLQEGAFPEFIITIDADTILEETYVERSIKAMRQDDSLGGLSAVCFGKTGIGRTTYQRFCAWTQQVEYARAAWMRIRTNIHTLSGAGSVLRGRAVLDVLADRGVLFAQRADNLVEDFELTLELKRHGWKCTNNYHCVAHTDLMPTLLGRNGQQGLWQQRCRWVLGTVNELRRRGWKRETYGSILTLIYGALSVPLYYVWPVLIAYNALHGHTRLRDFWVLPLLSLYQALAVRKLGWLSMLAAGTLVVEFLYGMLRHAWFLSSIARSYLFTHHTTDWS